MQRFSLVFYAVLLSMGSLLAGVLEPALAQSQEIRISGRVFLVRDKPGFPTEFQMIVNAGSADEAGGVSKGIAHYLEHLILVGRNAKNEDIATRFIPDARSNGWTNLQATAYTYSIPAREQGPAADLEKLFDFYAARLKDFSITAEDAERERNVVLQEFDWRYGSAPGLHFARKLDGAFYRNHPFAHSTSGTRESIQAMTLEDARAFHKSWYQINNVWFVIKGDIEPDILKAISGKSLAGAMPSALPARLHETPPVFDPERLTLNESDRQAQRISVSYRKLFRFDESSPAEGRAVASVLSSLLSTQLPGSLHEAIAEKKKLAAGSPGISISRLSAGTYALGVNAQPAPDVDVSVLNAAIEAYIAGLAVAEFSERNITRIKTRLADARKSSDAEPSGVYRRLTSWLASGYAYEEMSSYPGLQQGVSADELKKLATAAAGPGRVVLGVLTPEGKSP